MRLHLVCASNSSAHMQSIRKMTKPKDRTESLEWNKEIETYKSIIEFEKTNPFQPEWVLGIVHEMDERTKWRLASTLQFTIAKRRSLKKWPEPMFKKFLHQFIRKAQHENMSKQRLILFLYHEIYSLLEDEVKQDTFTNLIENKQQWTERYGPWHYFWATYFHPAREGSPEQWKMLTQEALHAVSDSTQGSQQAKEELATTLEIESESTPKTSLIEHKLYKEASLRQQLELEVAQLKKQLRKNKRKQEQLEHQLSTQRNSTEQAKKEAALVLSQVDSEQLKLRTEQAKWNTEKATFVDELQTKNDELHAKEIEVQKLQYQVKQVTEDYKRFQRTALEWRQAPLQTHVLIERLDKALHKDLASITQTLTQVTDAPTKTEQRRLTRNILDLLDNLDTYSASNQQNVQSKQSTQVTLSTQNSPISEEKENITSSYIGTFYRRTHGGFIQLENNETFNITESMVNNLDLQHEAEVQCWPKNRENGALVYDIELIFQGDDTYSPVRQHDGYVQLGEHYTFYCVDMNRPERRYPLHRKDVEIQQPIDGTPCTFNVSEDSDFARLSQLYRDCSPGFEKQTPSERKLKTKGKTRANNETSSKKPDPFLNDCTIAILGGQRKWFEEVVTETGAELIHDTGDHPERIFTAMRRSNALFLLTTSTSHRATWEGIDIVKTYGIPHFTIQGSKSNLRNLLWEHRRQILETSN